MLQKTDLANPVLHSHNFLSSMYADSYFPAALVGEIENILLHLCRDIGRDRPQTLEAFCRNTHSAVEKINALQQRFEEQGSKIETVARDAIAADVDFIVRAYGLDTDEDGLEELLAPRKW